MTTFATTTHPLTRRSTYPRTSPDAVAVELACSAVRAEQCDPVLAVFVEINKVGLPAIGVLVRDPFALAADKFGDHREHRRVFAFESPVIVLDVAGTAVLVEVSYHPRGP